MRQTNKRETVHLSVVAEVELLVGMRDLADDRTVLRARVRLYEGEGAGLAGGGDPGAVGVQHQPEVDQDDPAVAATVGPTGEAPDAYRRSVDDYYRALAQPREP